MRRLVLAAEVASLGFLTVWAVACSDREGHVGNLPPVAPAGTAITVPLPVEVQAPVPDTSPASALAAFEHGYRGFLAADARRQQCEADVAKDSGEDEATCLILEEQPSSLLGTLEALAERFPSRASALTPDITRLRSIVIAQLEAELASTGFDLTVNYGAQFREHQRCMETMPDGLIGDGQAMRARCGKDPEFRFACAVYAADIQAYLDVLKRGAPVEKIQRAQRALAWALEEPSVFFCEDIGERPEYERAYEIYVALGDTSSARRVAALRAYELLDRVCSEAYRYYDDSEYPGTTREMPARCDPASIVEAEEWLGHANVQPDDDWYARILGQAQWASHYADRFPDLACDAITIAERAGPKGVEELRKLRPAYGSKCPLTLPTGH